MLSALQAEIVRGTGSDGVEAGSIRGHLLAVSNTGEWAPWIDFFARAVCAEARSGHDRIMRLLALRTELGAAVRSNQANRNAVAALVEMGVLDPYRDERYGRLYWHRRVFQIIDS